MYAKLKFALLALTLGALLSGGVFPVAHAQDYPVRPIRWVVPYPPGGGADYTARLLSTKLGTGLAGQSIVVDNKPGGASVIGTQIVASAPADGYTIGLVTDSLAANDSLLKSLRYQSSDFEPVSLLMASPLVWVARSDAPVDSVQSAIAWIKSSKGALNYGSWGPGSTAHLVAEELSERAGLQMTHVPYAGAAPLMQAVLGGQVDMIFVTANLVLPYINSGKLKILAVTTKDRIPQLPELPALSETFPGIDASVWVGVVAPKGTPKGIVDKLSTAFQAALQQPDVTQPLIKRGEIVLNKSAGDLKALISSDSNRIRRLVSSRHITVN